MKSLLIFDLTQKNLNQIEEDLDRYIFDKNSSIVKFLRDTELGLKSLNKKI